MDRSAIEAVKARVSIAEVVRRYVDLKPVSGRWMGACPFHQETKPSMSVNDEEGFFYCFGCQASGDVIDFYGRINGLDFREALEQLAAEAGIELGNVAPDPQAAERKARKNLLMTMHDEASEWFRRNLRMAAGETARRYLSKRGMTPDVIEKFGLGYSPDDWHGLLNHLNSRGRTPDLGVEAGLLSKNDKGNIYDRFRGRLIFPIQNLSGRVIAFGGRIITEGEPKYLNSSDTPIYKKGDHLYGLHLARTTMTRSKRALLTEGYMDVISLHQFGYTDACGVLGTALTSDQVKRLAGFCSRVDLVFDGDNAGRKAALKSSRMILLQGVACRAVLLPDGEDVDSLLQTRGRDGFEACLADAPSGLDFCLETLRAQFAPREIMDWAKSFMAELADPSLRAYYLPRIAGGLGLSEADFRRDAGVAPARYAGQGQQGRGPARNVPQGQGRGAQPRPRNLTACGKEDKDDQYFLRFPIQYPDYVPELARRGFGQILGTQWARDIWEKLKHAQQGHVMSLLNEEEKRFYIRCREEMRENVLSGSELLDEWEHICNKIAFGQQKQDRQQLKEALREAQISGDSRRIDECFRALEESLRRDDEQH
ncbi:DNA primase [Pseudodesulfovibrio sp.]|uniref:DNA primase n=1 Tax=Pseudodesulfovibrio sp. TaxID=2035812 RepID=UPI0026168034|nr:DNA primase [Pseudodesulfovibrio sp.]MDD3312039.1 DNA primase [Pseudodesulfovibrio sp.]